MHYYGCRGCAPTWNADSPRQEPLKVELNFAGHTGELLSAAINRTLEACRMSSYDATREWQRRLAEGRKGSPP
jgi:hypothetical protein